jgi:hypothetical protein
LKITPPALDPTAKATFEKGIPSPHMAHRQGRAKNGKKNKFLNYT